MAATEPMTTIDAQFSSPGATPTPWAEARRHLEQAQVYWLATVRPDGRPHVTTLLAVWLDDAMFFCTGASERKAKNLVSNAQCSLTTGNNTLHEEGLDLVVEGDAVQVRDTAKLQRMADAYVAKYGEDWRFTVRDGAVEGNHDNVALVFEVAPTTVFGFGKGAVFSQTRWRF
jgi:pyridoxine/pyridoxamine 5'-phosphate oxidase